jgi:hypothetical protein
LPLAALFLGGKSGAWVDVDLVRAMDDQQKPLAALT